MIIDRLERGFRRIKHRVSPPAARFVYDRRQAVVLPHVPLDPQRFENTLAFLAKEGILRRRDVIAPRPVSMQTLRRVHSDEYLETVHSAFALSNILGSDISEDEVDEVLDVQRLICGGTIAAVKTALSRHTVGVNMGGGFHHAGPARGHGFCVFNDIAVAIAHQREAGFSDKIMVVDLDLHDGDGTRLCFAEDATVHTFSIHNQTWSDRPAVEATTIELGTQVGDHTYLESLKHELPRVLEQFDPKLIIYLAGVDPAFDDRIGDWKITAEGMLERDRFVLQMVRSKQVPLAIVLGGGYGPDAWRYTARFFSLLLEGKSIEPPSTDDLMLERFRYLAKLTTPEDLTGRGEDEISFDDVGIALGATRRTRFLDYYTRHGVELALERYGLLDHLRGKGFKNPTVTIDLQSDGDLLRVWGEPAKKNLLSEVRVRKDRGTLPGFELISVEWLLLQNPTQKFDETHPQLPGQEHPGLGLLNETVTALLIACERLNCDGLIFVPGHYHLALRSTKWMRFLHHEDQAHFDRIKAAIGDRSLVEASWALARGELLDADGAALKWIPKPMVIAVSDRLKARLDELARK